MSVDPPRVVLTAALAAALSTTPLAGCGAGSCGSYDATQFLRGKIQGGSLELIRESSEDDEERCEQACLELADDTEVIIEESMVVSCAAADMLGRTTAPWDPMNETLYVTVSCTLDARVQPLCTGRRPHGHVELADVDGSTLAWLRLHGHLERASIAAFEELAVWLAQRGAPEQLVQRCGAAARDEAIHAGLFDALVRRLGAEPAAVVKDAVIAGTARDVALHNAREGCVGEAFAAVIAAYQARHVGAPELRRVFARIAADELRHGQLAWDLHEHLRLALDDPGRQELDAALDDALDGLVAQARTVALAAPRDLGWPPPSEAEALAQRFVDAISEQRLAA